MVSLPLEKESTFFLERSILSANALLTVRKSSWKTRKTQVLESCTLTFCPLIFSHSDSERAIKVIWSGATLASTWFAPDNAIGVGFTLDYGCIMRLNSIRIAQILYKTINNR